MNWLRVWYLRVAGLFHKEQSDRELAAELESHLQLHIDDNLRAGMSPEEARRQALIKLGGVEQTKEKYRDRRGIPYLQDLLQDIRFGFRILRKSPGFTIVAVLTLAMGIGINATVFTLTNAVLFKGFPFDKNELIYYLGSRNPGRNFPGSGSPVSYPDFRDWQAQTKSFSGLAAARRMLIGLSDDSSLPENHFAAQMTANSFQIVGQKPVIGRDFTSADEALGAPPVAILTYGLWERRYGKDPSIIGRAVRINGVPTVVIGVMPKGVTFPVDLDLWVPMTPSADTEKREVRNLIVFGRMADGVTVKSARAEMGIIAHNLQSEYPVTNQGFAPVVLNYNEFTNGPRFTIIFTAMLVAVGFVLLIVCANLANLFLAHAVGRSREIAIRIALGAGRWRLVRQLLLESLILSVAGGVLGWWIAVRAVQIFDVVVTPLGKPSWFDFSMDYRAFIYLTVISIGTGLIFGLAPALRLSKADANTSLKDGGQGISVGTHGKRLSRFLVIGELALAMVLLAGAGLMIRSFLNAYRASLGVNTTNVLTMLVNLPQARYPQSIDQIAFNDRLGTRLKSLPGVESVALASAGPTGGSLSFPYELEGLPLDAQRRPSLSTVVISPDYFRVMGVGVLQGRVFAETDDASESSVVIINQRFAGMFWSGKDPLGKRLRLYDGENPGPWLTVVGVAPNIVQNDISRDEIDPLIYLPYRQKPLAAMTVLARTQVPPVSLEPEFRREMHGLDSDLPYYLVTFQELLERIYWFYRVFGVLFTIFAGIALLLAAVGLYALMANSVSRRTQEIGVRMALGATEGNILRLVLIDGMRQVVVGLVLGLAVAFGVMHGLRAVLVQVSPDDPATMVIASLILALAVALGCLIPARRAMKVDPMVALRHE